MRKETQNKWINLFEKNGIQTQKLGLQIHQEINLGYISTVYLGSIEDINFAAKMYKKRYNGKDLCILERDNIKKARKSIPEEVPEVLFASQFFQNQFERAILVMRLAEGKALSKESFNYEIFSKIIGTLTKLHKSNVCSLSVEAFTQRKKNMECSNAITQFLDLTESISKKRFFQHLQSLGDYYEKNESICRCKKTLIHGDLWWDNILVDREKIRIIDWLESRFGDYCRDLTQLKIGILDEILDDRKSDQYFDKIIKNYEEEFEDETLRERISYHLPMMYLEESFYLPFKYFSWKIKFKEDSSYFENRFLKYFDKSEKQRIRWLI